MTEAEAEGQKNMKSKSNHRNPATANRHEASRLLRRLTALITQTTTKSMKTTSRLPLPVTKNRQQAPLRTRTVLTTPPSPLNHPTSPAPPPKTLKSKPLPHLTATPPRPAAHSGRPSPPASPTAAPAASSATSSVNGSSTARQPPSPTNPSGPYS